VAGGALRYGADGVAAAVALRPRWSTKPGTARLLRGGGCEEQAKEPYSRPTATGSRLKSSGSGSPSTLFGAGASWKAHRNGCVNPAHPQEQIYLATLPAGEL
jgi:hypothetical protein